MKNIVILGSTGSIGKNALDIVRHFPDRFRVVGLSTRANVGILKKQIIEFKPRTVCVTDPRAAETLKQVAGVRVLTGKEGLRQLCADERVDKVVVAISGADALMPLLVAIEHKKEIALANKESLVMAGPLVMRRAGVNNVRIIPIDSEQSAIWQCLQGEDKGALRNIFLTASGGPLRDVPKEKFKDITARQVLRHPRWKMGSKVTVDSATMMNKGLELLEAMYLFDVKADDIKVLIHPEAIIHSMVEFIDGVIMAQLSVTDMRVPIQYALTYPDRIHNSLSGVDFFTLRALHFQKPDTGRFPCLRLAYRVAKAQGTFPCVLNAANEVCVEKFLKGDLHFIRIPEVIENVLDRHRGIKNPDLEDIFKADAWGRDKAREVIAKL